MKELVIDTSGDEGVVAVVRNGVLLRETRLTGGPELSKNFGLVVKDLVSEHGTDYDRIVVGIGPGSFTGIRVGVAMAESLSMGWGVPLHTVCSLLGYEGTVIVDARSGGFYVQQNQEPPQLLSPEQTLSLQPPLASPHPHKIQQRLPLPVTQTFLSPLRLSQFAQNDKQSLSYLDQNISIPYTKSSS